MPRAQIAIKGQTAMWIIEQDLPLSEIERMRDDGLPANIVVHEEEAGQVPPFVWDDDLGWMINIRKDEQ